MTLRSIPAYAAVEMRSSLFWDVTQRRSEVTDVSNPSAPSWVQSVHEYWGGGAGGYPETPANTDLR